MNKLLAFSVGDPGSLTTVSNLPGPIDKLLNNSNPINALLHLLFNTVFFVTALLAFAFLMWSGYKMMVAGGDKKNVEEARKMFFNAIIGLTVVCFAFLFINVIGAFFHVDLFNTKLK